MIKSILSTVLKGLVVGASMLVPGVSGGTTCIILGIYDKLIHAVSSFFSDIKHNFALLALFCLGGGIGMILFSRAMLWAVETWKLPMMCFFLGAILGSLPMLYRQAKVDRFKPVYILFAILGFAIVLALQFIPKPESGLAIGGIGQIALLFASGLVIAVALVLPGISTSQMLIVLGMYETTLQAIKPLLRHYLIAELRIQLRTGKHLTFTGQQGFFLSRKRSGLRGLFQNRKAGLLTPQLLTLLADGVIDALMLLQGAQLCL